MYFENNDFDFDVLNLAGFNFNNPTKYYEYSKRDDNLLNSKEGFLKGNMWGNLYDGYKNYKPVNLKPTNEREMLLYKIMEIDFAVNDLNLYLDIHPEDRSIYEKFKMYVNECLRLKDEYAKKYGPLSLDMDMSDSYTWLNNPWPWDKNGGSMYV